MYSYVYINDNFNICIFTYVCIGGSERVEELDKVRMEKQCKPVRRRYRSQEERDEMAAEARLVILK